jgi:nucleotide-binding universal stress UspA family protein
MEVFKRIMVALDHTYFDRELLAFTSYLTQMAHPEKVYFVHVDRDLEMPDNLLYEEESVKVRNIPKDEAIKTDLEKLVRKYFKEPQPISWQVEVIEGKPLQELLHWSRVKKIDLIITGHKKLSEGSGITARKLAREATCSVLFVPVGQKFPLQQIIVPFDFSGNSDCALKTAVQIVKETVGASVKAVHVFDVPIMNQYELTIDYQELVTNAFAYKKQLFDEYLQKQGLKHAGITLELIKNTTGRTASYLSDYAHTQQASLVVMGARGHSGLDAFLMGSVTEKFLALNSTVPTLVERCPSKQ